MALDPDAWDELCRRRAAGESLRVIAQSFGMSDTTLRRHIAAGRPAGAPKKKPASRKAAGRKTRSGQRPAQKPVRAAKPKPRKNSSASTTGGGVRRQLIARLYRAIDTKLKLMERRMTSEIDAIDAGGGNAATGEPSATTAARNSADHERETRAFGALVKTINSVRQMQAELDTLANAHTSSTASSAAPSPADARLAADAERYRRDIAQRLAKFVPPQS